MLPICILHVAANCNSCTLVTGNTQVALPLPIPTARFVERGETTTNDPTALPIPTARSKKYYAVARGHTVGVFYTDAEARAAYEGFSGAKHKGFRLIKDAREYIKKWQFPTASYVDASVAKRDYSCNQTPLLSSQPAPLPTSNSCTYRRVCAVGTCTMVPGKKRFTPGGFFKYCYRHRHLNC